MPKQVVNGAKLVCSGSVAPTPSILGVLPIFQTYSSSQVCATIQDHVPQVNIKPFGACKMPSNPQVASATTAAAGVLTPQPCIPVTPDPWTAGAPTFFIGSIKALDDTCKLSCKWAGIITVMDPGQTSEDIP